MHCILDYIIYQNTNYYRTLGTFDNGHSALCYLVASSASHYCTAVSENEDTEIPQCPLDSWQECIAFKSKKTFIKNGMLVDAAKQVLKVSNIQDITMRGYVNKVAQLRGVRYKGQSLKQVLSNLDVDDVARQNGTVTTKNGSRVRWQPLRDTTRLLHCMFAGGEQLLYLFKEMGVSMTRYV